MSDPIGPERRALFDDLDDAYKAASAALAVDDMDAWAEHAARGSALFEQVARLNGWRDDTPPARRTEQGGGIPNDPKRGI